MRVLVLSAHPDDESLGCGGTIARLSAEGHEVYIAIFTDGVSSREGATEYDRSARCSDYINAMAILRATTVFHNGYPDNQMDTVPLLKLASHMKSLIEAVGPDVIYTHHGGDVNQDHRAVFEATLIATRPQPGSTVKEVYCYEVPSSTEWAFGHHRPFVPNIFVDIAGEPLAKKIAAAQEYKGEMRPYPHPRSVEALEARARYWGSVAGVEAAEVFMLVRSVR